MQTKSGKQTKLEELDWISADDILGAELQKSERESHAN